MSLFDFDRIDSRIDELELKTMQEGFWNDSKTSSVVLQEMKVLKDKQTKFNKIHNEIKNLMELNDLLMVEEDEELLTELLNNTKLLERDLEKLEIETFLSRKI